MLQFWWHQEGPSNEQFLCLLIWSLGSLRHNATKRARESRYQLTVYIFLTSLWEAGIACMYLRPVFGWVIFGSPALRGHLMSNDKYLRKPPKSRKNSFCSPEILVYSPWFHGFWHMGRQNIMAVWSCGRFLTSWRIRRRKQREDWVPGTNGQRRAQYLFSPVRLHLNFPESLQLMLLATNHLPHKPVGDISYPSLITENHFVLSARD